MLWVLGGSLVSMERDNINSLETSRPRVSNIIARVVIHVVVYAAVVIGTIVIANKAYDFTYQIYGAVPVSAKSTETKKIEIKPGENGLQIADKLYREDLIVNKYSFFIRLKLSQRMVQPQKYELSNNMTYIEILDKICMKSSDDGE